MPGGPADRAGLRVGDVLLKIDDRDVMLSHTVESLAMRAVGTTVKLTVERADKELVIPLTIEAAPQ